MVRFMIPAFLSRGNSWLQWVLIGLIRARYHFCSFYQVRWSLVFVCVNNICSLAMEVIIVYMAVGDVIKAPFSSEVRR